MCETHAHTGSRNSRRSESAVPDQPKQGRGTPPSSRAAQEKPKTPAAAPKAAPAVPGIGGAKLPPATPAALPSKPVPTLPAVTPKAPLVTAEEKPKTPNAQDIPKVTGINEPKGTPPAAQATSSNQSSGQSILSTTSFPKPPAPEHSSTAINDGIAIISPQELLKRDLVNAKDLIPAGHSKNAPTYLGLIKSTLEVLKDYEREMRLDAKDLDVYRNRSLYMLYIRCFPEDFVRYSNATNFTTSNRGHEKRVLEQVYQKLKLLNLITGSREKDSQLTPRCMERLYKS